MTIDIEWGTPPAILDALRPPTGWDLDPASSPAFNATVRAAKFFSKENPDTGDWYGNVWVNPPYGRYLTGQWANRICDQAANCRLHALLPARLDTTWCRRVLALPGYQVWVLHRRLHFTPEAGREAPGTGRFASMLVVPSDLSPTDFVSATSLPISVLRPCTPSNSSRS